MTPAGVSTSTDLEGFRESTQALCAPVVTIYCNRLSFDKLPLKPAYRVSEDSADASSCLGELQE